MYIICFILILKNNVFSFFYNSIIIVHHFVLILLPFDGVIRLENYFFCKKKIENTILFFILYKPVRGEINETRNFLTEISTITALLANGRDHFL